jgi:predicted nucleic acid-binding protein
LGIICCDTSFLYSYCGTDAHTPAAAAELIRLRQPFFITNLNEFELGNALRLAEYRKVLQPGKAAIILAALRADEQAGKLVSSICDFESVLVQANRLSIQYTLIGGYRSFDILHVAAALHLGADIFLSFDAKQRTLAAAEGLTVRP